MTGLARLALLATIALAALLLACEGSTSTPTETPSPGAAPSPSATAPIDLSDVDHFRQGEPLHIGGDTVLIIETGCYQCDGPTKGLLRVYTRPDGRPVVDTLLDPAALGLGPRLVTTESGVERAEPVITGYAVRPDTAVIWASVCIAGTCGSGGLDAWSAGSRTALMRSTDGGVTWERVQTLDVGAFVIDLLDHDRPLIGTWDIDGAPPAFRGSPHFEEIDPPRPGAWPVYVHASGILWRSSGGGALLDGDGEVVVDFGADAIVSAVSAAPDKETGADVLAMWSSAAGRGPYYLTLVDVESRSAVTSYDFPGFMMVAPQGLAKGQAYGNAEFDPSRFPAARQVAAYQPAVFDLAGGIVHPLLVPFAEADFPGGRSHVAGVVRGPIYRVVSPDACLPLHLEPSGSSAEVACAADSVLLRGIGLSHAAETVEAGGVTWLRALTPGGLEGWADSAFLAR